MKGSIAILVIAEDRRRFGYVVCQESSEYITFPVTIPYDVYILFGGVRWDHRITAGTLALLTNTCRSSHSRSRSSKDDEGSTLTRINAEYDENVQG